MGESTFIMNAFQRVRQGDADAARELFDHFSRRLSRLAEQHLSRKLAARVEGDDVVQSVFRTFFRRSAQGEFQIDSSSQLWQLLVRITILKARGQARRHMAAVRDVEMELGDLTEEWLQTAAAQEPRPEEAIMLVDEIETLLQGLHPLYGEILEQRLQGHAVVDIASQLGVSRHTVYRALDLLRQRLTERP